MATQHMAAVGNPGVWSTYRFYVERIQGRRHAALLTQVALALLVLGTLDDGTGIGILDDVVVLPGWAVFVVRFWVIYRRGKRILRDSRA